FRYRWFMVFTVGNGVLSLYDTVLIVLLPIWVIEHTALPVALVPVLMAVNTVLTVLLQVYVARFADGPAAAIRLLVLSGALMAICCGFLAMGQAASATLAVFAILIAVVVLSAAENLQEVAAWELSAELSPEAARARYLGAFSLGFSGQKVIGPTLLVVVLMPIGLIAWPVLAGAFGTAALVSRTAAHRCLAEREHVAVAGRSTHPQPVEVNS
ncbi:MAG: MFS transporter, partial [Mycobacterium sp.]